jgi:PKD repeat protein
MYTFSWKNPAIPGKASFTVPVASTVSSAASLTFTGKGASNYGLIQQTNLMLLLENFADSTSPVNPTIGQLWYDSTGKVLCVCKSVAPLVWQPMGGIQITGPGQVPLTAALGDLWFEKTGNYSGFLYVYTGTGRYPNATWDPYAAGAFPQVSPLTMPYGGIKRNYQDFSTPNIGDAYIHGFNGAVAADVNAQINLNGALVTMAKGNLFLRFAGQYFILWDNSGTIPGANHFFSVRSVGADAWEYDTNNKWATFTPNASMYIIGTVTVANDDVNSGLGITGGEVWQTAVPIAQFIPAAFGGTVAPGGWEQIWPTIQFDGSRFEYDAMLALLLNFIGSPVTSGGNDGARGLPMTDMITLDAALAAFHIAQHPTLTRDPNFAPINSAEGVAMEPNSNDWDHLLAAARWAISRLDLPADMYTDISQTPFVQDGRVASSELQALPINDPRFIPAERRTQRRWGSITAARLYAETMNVLANALSVRYTLRGMLETNSTNVLPLNTLTVNTHSVHTSAYVGGFQSYLYDTLQFSTPQELTRFAAGGCAFDIVLSYSAASPTSFDTAFSGFLSTQNRVRIIADAGMTFNNSLALTQAPTAVGFLAATSSAYVTVASASSGSYSISAAVALVTPSASDPRAYSIRLSVVAPAGLTGTLTAITEVRRDVQAYGGTPFFPAPLAFIPNTDDAGSTGWTNVTFVAPPVANFTIGTNPIVVNPATGVALVTFTDTSTGAPTTIEWDFTNDSVINLSTAPGATTPAQSFTPGTYAVRMKASNLRGTSVVIKTIVVNP